jgi:hypothetical protein
MVESQHRLDTGSFQIINELSVMVNSKRIHWAQTVWQQTRPRNGKTIARESEALHQRDVFQILPAIIEIYRSCP